MRIRAILPQPETGEVEWILVQVDSTQNATGAAEVRDTHGSSKLYRFDLVSNQEWYWITATVSGIALNNDQDSVELWWNNTLQDRTATYSASRRGEVWLRLDTWGWLVPDQFWLRWDENDWDLQPQPTASPTPSSSTNPSPPTNHSGAPQGIRSAGTASSSGIVGSVSSSVPIGEAEKFLGKMVALEASASSRFLEPTAMPDPVSPDYEAEERAYLEWRRWWQRATLLFVGSGIAWMGLLIPDLVQGLKRMQRRRWRWSLLS